MHPEVRSVFLGLLLASLAGCSHDVKFAELSPKDQGRALDIEADTLIRLIDDALDARSKQAVTQRAIPNNTHWFIDCPNHDQKQMGHVLARVRNVFPSVEVEEKCPPRPREREQFFSASAEITALGPFTAEVWATSGVLYYGPDNDAKMPAFSGAGFKIHLMRECDRWVVDMMQVVLTMD